CFLEYAENVGKAWEVSEAPFNEHWFRGVVAKGITFRWTDRMVGGSDWYLQDRAYKAQVVTYSIAWLVHYLHNQGLELDLNVIWQRQELPEEIGGVLRQIAPQVAATVKEAPPQMKNVGEYCKQQACWAAVSASQYEFEGALEGLVIDRAEAERQRREAIATKKVDADIDFDRVIVAMLSNTEPCLDFARSKRLLSPKSDAALRRLSRGDIRLSAMERSALKHMLEKMQQAGFELPSVTAQTGSV
ncbi:MAG TPA: AIPR family protein, partial [Aliidongia sp.]|uniref:AIPR family protein n=1 Tax=Aliidongia sp. TaxID=1914230 RepID=UPI002DDC95CA